MSTVSRTKSAVRRAVRRGAPSWSVGVAVAGVGRTVVGEVREGYRSLRALDRHANIISVGVAARQGWAIAKDHNRTDAQALVSAAQHAALPSLAVVSPIIARQAAAAAEAAAQAAKRRRVAPATMAATIANTRTLRGVAYGAALVQPVLLGLAAYRGAKADDNKVRGAFRGMLSSFDPSAVFLERGAFETAFDSAFGRPTGARAMLRAIRHDQPMPSSAPRTEMAAYRPGVTPAIDRQSHDRHPYTRVDGRVVYGTRAQVEAWQSARK
jgi:hypothetical protein